MNVRKQMLRMFWLTLLFCSGVFASVDDDGTGLYLGPVAGYQEVRDADEGVWLWGAAARLKILSSIGGEASIQYRQEVYGKGLVTVKDWPVMVTGQLYFLPILYGVIGAGWYYTTFDYDQKKLPMFEDKTNHAFGWHFGAGLEFPLESVKLTADIRYVFLDYDFQEVPGLSGLESDCFMFTMGILFAL